MSVPLEKRKYINISSHKMRKTFLKYFYPKNYNLQDLIVADHKLEQMKPLPQVVFHVPVKATFQELMNPIHHLRIIAPVGRDGELDSSAPGKLLLREHESNLR